MDQSVLWKVTYGMYAVGVMDGTRPCGCIVNTVEQIALTPERFVMSVSKDNFTHELIERTGVFSVSILTESATPLLIASLGFQSGRDRDKYAKVAFERSPSGQPVLTEHSCGYLECKLEGIEDYGSHSLMSFSVTDAKALPGGRPMTYAYYHEVVKGRAPKNAPTYQEPAPK